MNSSGKQKTQRRLHIERMYATDRRQTSSGPLGPFVRRGRRGDELAPEKPGLIEDIEQGHYFT